MERRYYLGCLLGVSISGCTGQRRQNTRPPTTPTPTTSLFGVHPVSEAEKNHTDVEIVAFEELTVEEQEFLDGLMPKGGIECASRSDGWDSLYDSLPYGSSVYLEGEDDLYALYMSRADEVFIDSADYGEFPIADC